MFTAKSITRVTILSLDSLILINFLLEWVVNPAGNRLESSRNV